MEYIILPLLDNKYPNFRNYNKDLSGNVILSGIYADKNKLNFTLPKLDNITQVSGTSFRFILSVSKDVEDKNPKLFTSEQYYYDLQASIDEGNPYFSTYSIFNPFIVNVSIKDAIDLFAKLDPLEKDVPVAVIKNIFASGKEKGGKSVATTKIELGTKKSQLEDLRIQLKKLDDNIANDMRIVSEGNFKSFLRRDNKKSAAAELAKLKLEREATATAIKTLEADINSMTAVSKVPPTTPGAEPNTFAKPTIPDVTLRAEDIDIDYNNLVRYIDWMVSKTTYSTETAETGGVKPAEEIGEWAGELVDNYKSRLAKKEAARLQLLGSGSLNVSASVNSSGVIQPTNLTTGGNASDRMMNQMGNGTYNQYLQKTKALM